MISLTAALGIATVALGLVLTPGPNMVYLVSRSVTQGRRAGLVSLGGVALGFGCYLAATAAGLTVIFLAVPAAYTTLKIAGAGYLLWLAWQAVRPGGASAFEPREVPYDSPRRLFAMGLITNLLNPKIAVLYVAVLPQFVNANGGPIWLQSLQLGAIQIAVALGVNAAIVLGAGSITKVFHGRPGWLRVQRYLMGTVLGGLAVRLVTDSGRPATP